MAGKRELMRIAVRRDPSIPKTWGRARLRRAMAACLACFACRRERSWGKESKRYAVPHGSDITADWLPCLWLKPILDLASA